MEAPEYLVVGHVTKPHGTKGELFVWPLTDHVDEVFAPGKELLVGDEGGELDEGGETLVVESARPFKRGVLVKFAEHDDRDTVAELAKRYLLLPAGELVPLAEDEVYYHQLLNLEVFTTEGDRVGQVREVFETEPAHLLEVQGAAGRAHLIPFADRIVKKVDLEGRRIVIKPTPGLLEL